ncbi:hypothetical protein Tco_1491641 [Tanacetum coccineum]
MGGAHGRAYAIDSGIWNSVQWWCEGGCGGVEVWRQLVEIFEVVMAATAMEMQVGMMEVVSAMAGVGRKSPERRRKKGRREVVARVIIKMK